MYLTNSDPIHAPAPFCERRCVQKPCYEEITRIAANILLDVCVRHSGLGGAYFSSIFRFFSELVSMRIGPLQGEIVQKLEECEAWEWKLLECKLSEVIREIVEKGINLLPGKCLLIPGGWITDEGGHAMLYLLQKNHNN